MVQKSLKSRLLRGGLWVVGGKSSVIITGVLNSALLTRLLSHEEMGVYFLLFSFVFIASIVAQFGLNAAIVKIGAETLGNGLPKTAISNIVKIISLGLISITVVAVLVVTKLGDWIVLDLLELSELREKLWYVAIWMAILSGLHLFAEAFRAVHEIKMATLFRDVIHRAILLTILLSLWAIYKTTDLDTVIWMSIISLSTSWVLACVVLRKTIQGINTQSVHNNENTNSRLTTREIVQVAWPMLIANLIVRVSSEMGIWIVGTYLGQEHVALYGVSSRLIMLVATPLIVVNSVLPPIIAELNIQNRKKELEIATRSTATFAGIPAALLLCGFIFLGEFILDVVYGEFYRSAAIILSILGVGKLSTVWVGSCHKVLLMTGHQLTIMYVTLITSAVSVLAAILTVEDYGMISVAIAITTGIILQNIIFLILAKKKVGVWTHIKPSLLNPVTIRSLLRSRI